MSHDQDDMFESPLLSDGLYAQQEAIAKAVAHLRGLIPPGHERVEYEAQCLVGLTASTASSFTSSDRVSLEGTSFETAAAFQDLRKVMYRPGEGSWFSVKMTVWADGRTQTEFNYDQEPAIGSIPPTGITYLTDQHFFPIDEDKQPQWLKERLATGVEELHKYGKKSYPRWLKEMIASGNKPSWL